MSKYPSRLTGIVTCTDDGCDLKRTWSYDMPVRPSNEEIKRIAGRQYRFRTSLYERPDLGGHHTKTTVVWEHAK